jgi:phosphoribosylglycinamide formyltransferase-1
MALRIAVLLSGNGTSLENLLEERAQGRLDVDVTAVISSKPEAFGLERARRRGIPAHALSRRAYDDERGFNDAIHGLLAQDPPDLLVLAGFLSRIELRQYNGRAMNTHPSLIPAFCGKGFYGERVHRAVLEYGAKVTGATIHYCDEQYDTGPIILQRAIAVAEDDTPASLAERVAAVERELYPQAIQLHAQGRLRIESPAVSHSVPERGPPASGASGPPAPRAFARAQLVHQAAIGAADRARRSGARREAGAMDKRVLVVDDDRLIREMTRDALVQEGFRVATAATGREALSRLGDEGPFDLVITDLSMREMDGLELLDA